MSNTPFPVDLPELQWVEFQAAGFTKPVSGVIYRTDQPPCCGVTLGGISTGCVDIDQNMMLWRPTASESTWSRRGITKRA